MRTCDHALRGQKVDSVDPIKDCTVHNLQERLERHQTAVPCSELKSMRITLAVIQLSHSYMAMLAMSNSRMEELRPASYGLDQNQHLQG